MSNVVRLFSCPHSSGEAICTNCKHEWVAVAPAGDVQLDCPSCSTACGLFKHPFGPSVGDLSYSCNCGSDLFFIMKKPGAANGSTFCRGCGLEATGWFE